MLIIVCKKITMILLTITLLLLFNEYAYYKCSICKLYLVPLIIYIYLINVSTYTIINYCT